ncbi:hypothetical protein RZO55_23500 [Clostridium boliviensis]|uniref:YhgE/Pip domain-containing protein n=1 Tax=Clostridium boliviensis TaxID=318465 RepID=A0ABU4GSF2_9CLOT|nr:hypothetical protein [Clostridium boliviensis]MDW2800536.1 hypothetical protein [Clostridium boliviensis]
MNKHKRIFHIGLAVVFSMQSVLVPLASEVQPPYDETLYVTMDPYGEIKESSIVKVYRMNGSEPLTDYGTYDKVINLTDHSQPVIGEDGSVTFHPEEGENRFYFEGQTKTEKKELPWNITVSYRLNGVEKKADELAGEKGLIEVNVDLVPNKGVSDYYKNNMTLMGSAVVDMDKNLSLEAEGAQVQTVGNLSTVAFFALPGEEGHYSIRIGTDDFKFTGIVFAMVPLTVSQLDKVKDLREAKETMEDSADEISASLDVVLNTMEQMKKSIDTTSDGIRGLDKTRQIVADSKGKVYQNADDALTALDGLSQTLRPFYNHTENAKNALNELRNQTNHLTEILSDLSPDLKDLQEGVRELRDELEELQRLANSPETGLKAQMFFKQLDKTQEHLNTLTQQQRTLAEELASLAQMLPQLTALTGSLSASAQGLSSEDLEELLEDVSEEGLADEAEISSYLFNERGYSVTEISALTSYLTSALETENLASPSSASSADSSAASQAAIKAAAPLAKILPQLADSGAVLTSDMTNFLGLAKVLLGDLYAEKNHINGAADGVIKGADSIGQLCDTADDLIGNAEELNGILHRHHDEMLNTLTDMGKMTDSASRGIDSMNVFLRSLEDQMKTVGNSLNGSTQKTLNGLADTLNVAGNGLNQTEVLRNAKDTIKKTIDDKWDEYTTEDTTLLNIDLEAKPVSMTSAKNPAPKSIQIILRTGEIKQDEENSDLAVDEDFHPDGSVFHRIGNIFKSIFHFFTSIFK